MPLMLDLTDEDLIEKWLDPDFSDVEQFARCPSRVCPVP